MKDIKIIQMCNEHINEFLDPAAVLFDKYRQFYRQPSNLAQSKSFLGERIEDQDSAIFIALYNSTEVVGFMQLFPTFSSISAKRKWILNDLYVSEKSRRQGVAKQLMARAAQLGAETKADSIFLETQLSNVSAQALYESLGYVREEEHFTYFLKISKK